MDSEIKKTNFFPIIDFKRPSHLISMILLFLSLIPFILKIATDIPYMMLVQDILVYSSFVLFWGDNYFLSVKVRQRSILLLLIMIISGVLLLLKFADIITIIVSGHYFF